MKKNNIFTAIILLGLVGSISMAMFPTSTTEIHILEPFSSSELPDGDVKYLIITPEAFVPSLEGLALWKTQKGVNAYIETMENIEDVYTGIDTQEKMKNCIEFFHDTYNTEFVLLAGNNYNVPTREVYIFEGYEYDGNYVGCDTYYANLNDWNSNQDQWYGADDDDWSLSPDVYVGRLSALYPAEMKMLADRIIRYESNPPVGDWMNRGLFAGSMTYFESDYYYPADDGISDYPEADGNRFFNNVSGFFDDDMDITLLAENVSGSNVGISGTSKYPFDAPLNSTTLKQGIDNGTSILGVLGHGSPTIIQRTIWYNDRDGDGLFDWYGEVNEGARDGKVGINMIDTAESGYTNPNNMLSVAYLMGCSNGNFTTGTVSLAEYMVKTVSIGSIGGDCIVWGEDGWTEREYGGWYSEGLSYRFFEQLTTHDQPGKALALAKQDYFEDNITYDLSATTMVYEPKWSEKTLKQFNYFGDPELHVWMDVPNELDATWTAYNSTATIVEVSSGILGVIDSASVTLTNKSTDTVYWSGTTNSSGQIVIPHPYVDVNDSVIVGYKPTYLPLNYKPWEPPAPEVPLLFDISPEVDQDGRIKLVWSDVDDAVSYNIYRHSGEITDVTGLTPIGTSEKPLYTDRGLTDGIYGYVVTAVGLSESDPSNCVFVTVDRRYIPGFSITIISIVGFLALVVIAGVVITRVKSRN